ncbi:unnamed protein product [Microthlaspi erraticum]|uniref:Uncharacterized protein n=1 Tax=Microthlaspi erraticum TaxID=1685480 RepID=A0A6D2JM17_9BRAS|nr:unnamed protein product [Microthlaspi erraticum]
MDFIKTSSLRALIELTFQRNWNGLIWMSRKGVTTKRVKTVQTALSRISAQTAQSGWPRNVVPLGQNIRPSEVSAKVQTTGRHSMTREYVPRSAKPHHRHAAHDHAARAGKQASRPRNLLAYHGRCAVRAGKNVPSGREHRPIFTRPTSGRRESIRPRPFRSPRHDPIIRPIVPTDRPTPRSTRSPF